MEINRFLKNEKPYSELNNIENNNCFLNQIEIILQGIENDEVK